MPPTPLRRSHGWEANPNDVHFTSISAGWLNAVEGFFAILIKRNLGRGKQRRYQGCHDRFVVDHNQKPKPFAWDRRSSQNHLRRRTWAPGAGVKPMTLEMVVRQSAPNVHSPEKRPTGKLDPTRTGP
jgi:hypothetical protein